MSGKKKTKPSKYDPKYCEMIIDHCKNGQTIETFAVIACVSRKTLYNWKEQYPEFAEACDMAMAWQQYDCLKDLNDIAKGVHRGSAPVAIFRAKNILKWKDNPVEEQADKGKIKIELAYNPMLKLEEDKKKKEDDEDIVIN
jgi:hypothetical protein